MSTLKHQPPMNLPMTVMPCSCGDTGCRSAFIEPSVVYNQGAISRDYAEYLVQAGNAYPKLLDDRRKLVEALRALALECQQCEERFAPTGNKELDLLRELGEASVTKTEYQVPISKSGAFDGPLFSVTGQPCYFTLAAMLGAHFDEADTCEWLRTAPLHAELPIRGGAAPLRVIRRES